MTPLRLVLLAAVVAAAPAWAQSVTVSVEPALPIAGLPVTAVITFSASAPQSVSAFVRPVGSVAYQELVAADIGNGVWRVELPFPAPPQGIDAFARYVIDGQTFSTPQSNPEAFPFRLPSFLPALAADLALPARQYRMVTVPARLGDFGGLPVTLGNAAPLAVFGDDFGPGGDPSQWRLLRWNEAAGRALDAIADGAIQLVQPGEGYWLITSGGGAFDIEGGLSAGFRVGDGATVPDAITVPLASGWTQIGNPFLFPIAWADVDRPASVEAPVAFDGQYAGGQTVLRPFEGYFVFNSGGPTALRFSATPRAVDARTADDRPLAARLLDQAGPGARAARVTASAAGRSDAVVVGVRGASGGRTDLHKPPAVDDGIRLAVRESGADWLGQFRSDADWTLALTTDADAVVRVETLGDWPGGLAVDDLDRGVTLAVSDGRVTVPALVGVPTRSLRLRATDAVAEPTLGRPSPNPSAGIVTVPFRLAAPGPVRADVVDVLGRVVRVLLLDDLDAGAHLLSWDGHDGAGRRVAAGAYLLRLDADGSRSAVRVTRPR
ncbi:FlgD immunoglobulin-like domain containing protein [Rubrivirga sp. IMCC43871]|uniref:FlgD immunoglobulin-like domain containing protein n=1 Tax=Rubrivirga sp. IMCC43871 TaxID=3391575 RepID=UPI0039903947